MKKTIAILLLMFPLFSIAQITYEPGYFIEKGTKTECLIKNVAWKNNPVSFEYRLTQDGETKIKTINEVSEFNVNDAYQFRRFTLNIDRSETTLNKLNNNKMPEWKTETVYLKVLVEGKITLYQYEDSNFVKYFFGTEDSKAEQLVHKEYIKDGSVAQNNQYQQQLYLLMKDKYEAGTFEKLKYKKDALVKLFLDYNGGEGNKVTDHTQKQNKGSVNLKITPGATFNALKMSNDASGSSYSFGNKASFRIGAELEYVMPFNNNKWSLFLDPNYQSFSNDEKQGTQVRKVDYTYLEIPVGVRHYMFLNSNARFFIDGAYVMAIPVSDSFIKYNGSVIDIEKNSGLALGAGFAYKNYSIEIRQNFNHGIINYTYWTAEHSSTNIILGYKIL